MKRSEETINCEECDKVTLKYPVLSYNRPRKFCSKLCSIVFSRKHSVTGEKHHCWKGKKACYTTQHQWINHNYGKANGCDQCHTLTAKMYHWANISGKYRRSIKDYKQLCVSCHIKFNHLNKYGDKCRNGHKRPPEHLRIDSSGRWKDCVICRRTRERIFRKKQRKFWEELQRN